MKNILLSLLSLLLVSAAFAQSNGQWELRKYGTNGFTSTFLDSINGRAIGFTAGNPAMLEILSPTTAAATYQPLDSDLTSIAALTTTSYGRGLLTSASASALRSSIAALPVASPTATGTLTIDGAGAQLRFYNESTFAFSLLKGSAADSTHILPPVGGTLLNEYSTVGIGQLEASSITINGTEVALGESVTISVSPGGSSGQIQYNNGGSFAGVTGMTTSTGTLKTITLPTSADFQISHARVAGITFGSTAASAQIAINAFNSTLHFHTSSSTDSSYLSAQLNINELGLASTVDLLWAATSASAGKDVGLGRAAAGIMRLRGATATSGAALRVFERSAPASAPPSDSADIWLEDNGSGKSRLMVRFPTGATQQIAIEP